MSALETWIEKLEFLQRELAICSDPSQRFSLQKQIEEAKAKILELGGALPTSPTHTPRPQEQPDDQVEGTMRVEDVRGRVDVAILTIRMDEFQAVLGRFDDQVTVEGGKNLYKLAQVTTRSGATTSVAMSRILEPGQGQAQAIARNLIDDLDPTWLFLVGIGGGTPDAEYSLGDVVLSRRLHDFSVSAWEKDGTVGFARGGGPMHTDVEKLLAFLPAIEQEIGALERERFDWP